MKNNILKYELLAFLDEWKDKYNTIQELIDDLENDELSDNAIVVKWDRPKNVKVDK